jgi:hypothetical protein
MTAQKITIAQNPGAMLKIFAIIFSLQFEFLPTP